MPHLFLFVLMLCNFTFISQQVSLVASVNLDSRKSNISLTPNLNAKNDSNSVPNPSYFWQQLQKNQLKYELEKEKAETTKQDTEESNKVLDFRFDEHKYSLEEILLRPGLMLEMLGFKNYDPGFMKLSAPEDVEEVDYPSMPSRLPRIDDFFSRRVVRLPYGNLMKLRFLERRSRRKLRKFLWAFTSCPVRYRWRDLGKGFWPQWIKDGECVKSESSCSVPAGMTCKRKTYKTVQVLHYLCPKHWSRKNCRWAKQPLQILTECKCQC